MVSNASTEQLSLLFRFATASVNWFRLTRSGTGSRKSLPRLRQSPGARGSCPVWLVTRNELCCAQSKWQMRQGFSGGGLAKCNGGETPLPTGYWNILLTPPVSFHPAETSCVSHFCSHLSLPKYMDRPLKSGKKGGC